MQTNLMEQLIYENSAQKVSELLIQCVTKYDCLYAEVYRYSHFDNLIEGFLEINNQKEINKPIERKDTLLGMPLLYYRLRECEPLFLNQQQLATQIPPKYTLASDTKAVAAMPIQKNEVAIGLLAIHFDHHLSNSKQHELCQFATYASTQIIKITPKTTNNNSFSPRELKTMQLIAEGWTTLEIANFFLLSEATVKHYIKMFMKKSNTYNRAHAVGYYMKYLHD